MGSVTDQNQETALSGGCLTRVDVHHHFVPKCYIDAFLTTNGDPSGWSLPKWNPETSLALMDAHGTRTSILSLTAPGPGILKDTVAATKLARDVNLAAAAVRDGNPARFGFFAAMPPLNDNIPAVLEEITYALDELHADGITLFTRYGSGSTYLGHSSFAPVWAELNKRGAVVFIHPTHLVDTTLVNPSLPHPVIDYPQETCRAATDLILSGTITAFPRPRIILSHAGGTFPYLATRAAHLTYDAGLTKITPQQFLTQARSFYFDLALSGNPHTVKFILDFADKGHVLYGSDFPYAPTKTIMTHLELLKEAVVVESKELIRGIENGVAIELIPRLRNFT